MELLNVVVTVLAKWTCPAVFIPGNHDQVIFSTDSPGLLLALVAVEFARNSGTMEFNEYSFLQNMLCG